MATIPAGKPTGLSQETRSLLCSSLPDCVPRLLQPGIHPSQQPLQALGLPTRLCLFVIIRFSLRISVGGEVPRTCGQPVKYLVNRVLLGSGSLARVFLSLRTTVNPSSETVSHGWQVSLFR
jgi:hypothetical protein